MVATGIIAAVCLLFIIGVYNTLVRKQNSIENAFGSIDVMLKKRFDLIPNIVATVKQYAKHEETIFARIAELRSKGYEQLSNDDKANFDKVFTQASHRFTAVAESYPELKASDNFMHLQRTLNEVEEQLSAARRTYNANVTDFNNTVMAFPSNMIAGMFGFKPRTLFSIPAEEQANPTIGNTFQS